MGFNHAQNNLPFENSISTSNRFSVIDDENATGDERNMFTPSCTGSKKASSPLDAEQTSKQHRECSSVDSNDDPQNQSHDDVCSPGTVEMISDVWGLPGDDIIGQHELNNWFLEHNSVRPEKPQAGKTQHKILTLNVCGFTSKLLSSEFISLINRHDIIGLQETKTDDTDAYLDIPGYQIFYHNRECISRCRSGVLLY